MSASVDASAPLSPEEPEEQSAPIAVEPEFRVLGARAPRHAALPTLEFDVHVSEPSGHHVYTIALSVQIMLEPARRTYDAGTHERLIELFGSPERWAVTTQRLPWHRADVLVPGFTGATTFRVPVPCSYDLELAAAKYFYSLPDGEVPLAFNFNGTIHYRAPDGRLQITLVPWSATTEFRLPVATWRALIERYYPGSAWAALRSDTLERLQREKARRGLPTVDACVTQLLEQVE
jgi:Family of unknown function (DUF6084)